MSRLLPTIAVAAAASLAGCGNACQATCRSMADFAASECGLTVPETDLDACIERQSAASAEDAKACRDAGPENIQWTCDDLALYFGGGAEG